MPPESTQDACQDKARLFLSYDFDVDAQRADIIRAMGIVQTRAPVSHDAWSAIARDERAFRTWVDEGMMQVDAVLILAGARTALRPRIRYEIRRAIDLGKPVFAVRIHALVPDGPGGGIRGRNPFGRLNLLDASGEPIRPHVYEPNPLRAEASIHSRLVHWTTLAWHAQVARDRKATAQAGILTQHHPRH